MTKRLVIIDADGILYAAALKGETSCDGQQMEMRPIAKTIADCYQRIEDVMDACGADECYLALSDRRNFRYDIDATYKGNRKASTRPLQLDRLRNAVSEDSPHRVFLIAGLEADDVCGIMAGTLQKTGREVVIASPDKDLKTIPGLLYRDGKVMEVTRAQADRFHIGQTLEGDTTDGYKGCRGWGPRKVGRLFDEADANNWTLAELWQAVIQAFIEAGGTEEDALRQARLSRILRVEDWDAQAKKPKLFAFPRD